MTMKHDEVAARSRAQFEAFNTDDWETFRAFLPDNAVYQEIGTGLRVEGADAYVEACRAWKQAMPDVRGEIMRTAFGDDTLVEEIVWQGTQTGPITLPNGQTLPPSGQVVRTEAVMWSRVDDQGRVLEARHYLDVLSLLVQVGALPQASPDGQ